MRWRLRNTAWSIGFVVGLSTILLTVFGFVAILNWRRSTILLAERQAEQAADRLLLALTRDMQDAQRTVLSNATLPYSLPFGQGWRQEEAADPHAALARASGALARFQYLDSVFYWRRDQRPSDAMFFSRRERLPVWMSSLNEPDTYPLVTRTNIDISTQLLNRINLDAAQGRQMSVFEMTLLGIPHQVVARLAYSDALSQHLSGVIGFTVNIQWTRTHYFAELVEQLRPSDEDADKVHLTIRDEAQAWVAGSSAPIGQSRTRRPFFLMFFDPLEVVGQLPPDVASHIWTVEALPASDSQLAAAMRGTTRLLAFGGFACLTVIVGLALAFRAAVSAMRLSTLRSDFVSSVSHEFKAPLATIRAAGDLLASGRVAGASGQRDYAGAIVEEAKRLTRLVDNLLAFSRVTDVATIYTFERTELGPLVTTALQRLRVQLANARFAVVVDVPTDVPPLHADHDAMLLMFENFIDNAIRYCGEHRRIEISGRRSGDMVTVAVRDFGLGIPEDDIVHVTKRFYRAANAGATGTGIGLAIAKRIVLDHGGTLEIQSTVGVETTVQVTLPASSQRL